MIVADANLILCFVWPDQASRDVDAVWLRDSSWTSPPLWRSEMRSAFVKHARRGNCTIDEAVAAIDRAAAILEEVGADVSTRVVLELAQRSGCSTYDCEYVALAAALGVPLVTMDRQVLREFPDIAVTPASFARPGP